MSTEEMKVLMTALLESKNHQCHLVLKTAINQKAVKKKNLIMLLKLMV
jgi:hypothetical protein